MICQKKYRNQGNGCNLENGVTVTCSRESDLDCEGLFQRPGSCVMDLATNIATDDIICTACIEDVVEHLDDHN